MRKRQLSDANKPLIKVRVLRACGVGGKMLNAGETHTLPRLAALELVGCNKAELIA